MRGEIVTVRNGCGIVAVLAKSVNNNLSIWQVADGFEGRVKEAFDSATLAEIAEKTGENYHTLRNWLKGTRDAPPRFLVAVAELTNHSPYWLLTGKGPKRLGLATERRDVDRLNPKLKAEIERLILDVLEARTGQSQK